ncbi:transcription/translation regulatory transformer protein RfaH [uncultured Thiothrix sp.]|uniref:transcription/translation regulatory transformer protein RfaH n=1 Tax=uncultured Thiothrix sp. TaxID=223185 RepID=UPI002618F78A|nr:transcription/translation regulatory transformer protein RfaH [uncultured Thiothrix sp.]
MSLTSAPKRQWYLLTSKPFKDELAEVELGKQGYEVYRPLAQRLRKQRGKMITKTESLFPRYLFIALNELTDNWAPIRSTKGVHQFVRFGVQPALVPHELIFNLKNQELALGERAIDLDRFHQGDLVTLTEGPFQGLNGIFMNYDGEERAIILLEILHKQTKLAISPAKLLTA